MRATFVSHGPEDTVALGEAVGEAARPGLVVGLSGDLGAGKTVFTKGIAKGLGCPRWQRVTSPTFTLHNVYAGRLGLHHLDLYRLAEGGALGDAGLDEVLYGPDVCVIEWPDLFLAEFPEDRLMVRLDCPGGAGDVRHVDMTASGSTSEAVLRAVVARVEARLRREVLDGDV
ncbi:tRNA (adenosine(37)-N6)-threonylcarbamoyltransferase complex ATPase subunit type 1 TsaE [Deferrisoma sp.]